MLLMEQMTERSGMSRWTLMKELQIGRLHGAQNGVRGTWRVSEPCFEAWLVGEKCEHQAVEAA